MDCKKLAADMEDYIGVYQEQKPNIEALCDRAKETLFTSLSYEFLNEIINDGMIPNSSLTPIEQIFQVAYYALVGRENRFISFKRHDTLWEHIPLSMVFECLSPQEHVEIDGKRYVIDFAINLENFFDGCDLKFAVELDGFEYHSKKKQMDKDYERERVLLRSGYMVIRFTGSQVYTKPFSCAAELIDLVLSESKDFFTIEE